MASIILTIPDNLLATYSRFQQENGVDWAASFLVEKLKELAQRHQEADAQDIFAKLTPGERNQFKARVKP